MHILTHTYVHTSLFSQFTETIGGGCIRLSLDCAAAAFCALAYSVVFHIHYTYMIKACSRSSFDRGSPAWKAGMLPRRYGDLFSEAGFLIL